MRAIIAELLDLDRRVDADVDRLAEVVQVRGRVGEVAPGGRAIANNRAEGLTQCLRPVASCGPDVSDKNTEMRDWQRVHRRLTFPEAWTLIPRASLSTAARAIGVVESVFAFMDSHDLSHRE